MATFAARYEFKYFLRPDQEEYVRELVSWFCDPDAAGDNGTYTVTSLYFDSWDWMCAMQVVDGLLDRFKLRVRTYDFTEAQEVFAEEKGRVGLTILKNRAHVRRAQIRDIILGKPPPPKGYRALKAKDQPALDSFRNKMDRYDLRPRLWVAYDREAYGSSFGDGARLTFDRSIRVQGFNEDDAFRPHPDRWLHTPLPSNTKLELKFNGAWPFWMKRLVHSLGLRRISCSKYVTGVETLGDAPWNTVERRQEWTVY